MLQLYRRALDVWTVDYHAREAIGECSRLSATVSVCLLRRRRSTTELASAIADMEIICERLRLIVGDGLVDLEKVESLGRLQANLALAEQANGIGDEPGEGAQ